MTTTDSSTAGDSTGSSTEGDARADELRAIAARGAAELGWNAPAKDVLVWATETFGDRLVVASAMQDAMVIDLVTSVKPDVDVLFLDTGYHFAETLGTRDAVAQVYGVNLVEAKAQQTVAEQDALLGKDLFARDPNECCRLRKVVPLKETLKGYQAWVTGIRRVEAPTRANAPLISFDDAFGLVKINPIAAWSDEDMQNYIDEHGILVNPLVDEGYPSIGCAPCTAKPLPGADPRSGRWAGRAKIECGLHAS